MSEERPSTNRPASEWYAPSTTCCAVPNALRRQAGLPPSVEGYDNLVRVGEGGMGVVYQARDVKLKRPVALKMLKAGTYSAESVQRFRTEAEALARLQHPHIVQVFAWEEPEKQPVLVLEYVGGGTLLDVLERECLEVNEAARLVAVLARAVHAAHAAGVVHRDLKPGNVLMAPPLEGNSGTVCGGFPKISDFGLANLVDVRRYTEDGILLGTPAYMAPEQAEGRTDEIGAAVDVWALGVMLYESLTKQLPFPGKRTEDILHRVLHSSPRALSRCRRGVPAELEAICAECLAKRPEDRLSADELAARLERFVAEGGERKEMRANPPVRSARTRRRLGRSLLYLVVLATALGGGVGVLAKHFYTPEPAGQRSEAGAKPQQEQQLRVVSLQVKHVSSRAILGEKAVTVHPGDKVRITAELSEPAYGFVISLGPDGQERLLWPENTKTPPPKQARLSVPATGEGALSLSNYKRGGMQAIAVVISRKPFPAFAEWQEENEPREWHHMPPSRQLFVDDGGKITTIRPGGGADHPPPGPLMFKLDELSQSLRDAKNVEATRMLVFPVKGDRPPKPWED